MAEDEILTVGIDLDVKQAILRSARFQRDMLKHMDAIAQAVEAATKANAELGKKASKATDEWTDSVEALTEAQGKQEKQTGKIVEMIEELHKKAAQASGEELQAIQAQIKALENLRRKRREDGENASKRAKSHMPKFRETAKRAGEEFAEAVRSLFQKDLKGAFKNGAKGAAEALSLAQLPGAKLVLGGRHLRRFGDSMLAQGREKAGFRGMAQAGVGQSLKAVGGLVNNMGGLLRTVAKIGPLVGTISTAMLGVINTLIDAEAQAKTFQKELLQSAGTTELLAASAGNTDLAFVHLEDTLQGIRDAAFSLDNLDWGTSSDEHKAVMNVLNQEGVSIRRIREEAENADKSVGDLAAELTHTSVAYSRGFGVPLQEINQLQAEMLTELSLNVDQTKLQLEQMNRAMGESNIAANKFFAMIRGVSQDLSLWGSRMEDAVKLLGQLGKVMSPRNAQKFLQTAVQGLRNMGRQDRLRLSLLAGEGKMNKLVQRDIQRKAVGLARSLGIEADELVSRMQREGPAGLEAAIKALPSEMQGATREALIDMQLQMQRAGKGTLGVAGAARALGPAGALQAMQAALVKWGGGKTLREGVGTIGMEMMAENLGISEDQLDQMVKFEAAIDNQREILKDQLASGDADQVMLAREALKASGVQADTQEALAKEVDKAGYDQIMDTLDTNTKQQLLEGTKVEDLAKKQTALTQSMVDKLGTLVDFVMNQLFNVLTEIWDTILSFPFVGDKSKQAKAAAFRKLRTGQSQLRTIAMGDDVNKSLANSSLMQNFAKAIAQLAPALEERKKLETDLAAASPEQRSQIEQRLNGLNQQIDQLGSLRRIVEKGFSSTELVQAAAMSGVDPTNVRRFRTAINGGADPANALYDVFGEADINEILKKTVWTGATDARKIDVFGAVERELAQLGLKTTGTRGPARGTASVVRSDSPERQALRVAMGHQTTAELAADIAGEQLDEMRAVEKKLGNVRMDSAFLKSDYARTMEEAVLEAMRLALFEYYLYNDLSRSHVAEHLARTGAGPKEFGRLMARQAAIGLTGVEALQANASGGLVTGVHGGVATVAAAAGEGLASVAPGERIVPAASSSKVPPIHIHVDGVGGHDLAKIIHAKVVDGIHEYKRRERFT